MCTYNTAVFVLLTPVIRIRISRSCIYFPPLTTNSRLYRVDIQVPWCGLAGVVVAYCPAVDSICICICLYLEVGETDNAANEHNGTGEGAEKYNDS